MELCDKTKCTGCQACRLSCPKKAISMTQTQEKKSIPIINESLCVDCGLCNRVCPVLNEPEFALPIKTYAAWTLNDEDRVRCASGGIATGLYRYILGKGGVIYGCDYDDTLKPIIRRSEDIKDISLFRTSKYVQSSVEDSYASVKKDLENERSVLYIGSPCQIDGLLHFLGKRKSYNNLYTVDIICHGVPPYQYLQEYVQAISKGSKVTKVGFRGDHDFNFTLYHDDELIYNRTSWDDYYFSAFLEGVIYRDNCYECRYARKERISDITIGDFWGIDKSTLKEQCKGRISVILANTKKGLSLLDNIDGLYMEERTLEEAARENKQLNHPMPLHKDRAAFIDNLDKGVYYALKKTGIGKNITFKNSVRSTPVYRLYKKVKK